MSDDEPGRDPFGPPDGPGPLGGPGSLDGLDHHRLRALLERLGVAVEDGPAARPGTLAAVVVTRTGAAPDPDELRGFLATRLPAEYVPRRVVAVPRLPRLPNGKTDLRELGRIAARGPALPADRTAPATDTERWLAGVWSELLGAEQVRAGDDFFELGGNSLRAVRMLSYVEDVLGRRPRVRTVFDAPTLSAFARAVDALGADLPGYRGRAATAARVYGLGDAAVAEQLAALGGRHPIDREARSAAAQDRESGPRRGL